MPHPLRNFISSLQNNPEGVVMVKFATEEALGLAMATLNGRYVVCFEVCVQGAFC